MDDCPVCRSICSSIPYSHFFSLHVSGDCMPIIRRNNCIYATLGTCYSVWMTGVQKHMLLHTRQSFLFSTCFGRLYAHHQEKQPYLCDTWYLLFCMNDCLVCRSICSCIPDSHLYKLASTKCRKNTVISPDDGHIVSRNM